MLDPELIRLAQAAWEATKDDSQPSWNDCQPSHRQKYLTAAKAAIKTQVAQTPFEQKVLELSKRAEGAAVMREIARDPEAFKQPVTAYVPSRRDFNESDYAMPHSEFVKDREESEPKPVLQHGDEEIAAQVGVKVGQHETEGAAKIGDAPEEKKKKASKKAAGKKSSKKAKES